MYQGKVEETEEELALAHDMQKFGMTANGKGFYKDTWLMKLYQQTNDHLPP